MQDQLIDRIYESAFAPELWPSILDELSTIAGARGGVLFAAHDKVLNWTASAQMHEIFRSYVVDGWLMRCTRRACLLTNQSQGFLVEQDMWKEEDLAQNPIYRDFLRPVGLGWSAGTALPMPTRDTIVVSLERDYARGPVEPAQIEQLNALRPHLARSAFVAARLKLRHAQGASDALLALGLPAFILGAGGVVLAANDLVATISGLVRGRAQERLVLTDAKANKILQIAIAEPKRFENSFPTRDETGAASHVVHLIPIRNSARDLFGNSVALVVCTPVTAPNAPAVELLRSLFDLTPAEAVVARAIAAGNKLEEIASNSGVAITTARSHLSSILAKTGCRRQTELALLLGGLVFDRRRSTPPKIGGS